MGRVGKGRDMRDERLEVLVETRWKMEDGGGWNRIRMHAGHRVSRKDSQPA